MPAVTENRIAGAFADEADHIRKTWGWFLAFAIVQVVVGMLAVGFAFVATLASVVMLGILLPVAAGTELPAAVWAETGAAAVPGNGLRLGLSDPTRPGVARHERHHLR
jgi:uncharacterized membrane protein HdeD (DUF308 family)